MQQECNGLTRRNRDLLAQSQIKSLSEYFLSSTCFLGDFLLLIDLILSQGKWIKVFGIMNLQMSYANLEEYKKTVEKQLKDADKKLAENMATVQRLNRDKEHKDKEMYDLEASARAIIDIVDPP